ncbi:MAG: cob(I)yrinic acid a,c-diamide adenosyltransferase [Terrimicrobiaceae bacterium]|nr:cob(I)yrinic acid a,c-diamide adenosyltransferase [Terrimicrobiaceae bacterium]
MKSRAGAGQWDFFALAADAPARQDAAMSVATKTGDNGTTALFAGPRVPKDDPRIEAFGTVDEVNSHLGVALAAGLEFSVARSVRDIQGMLFVLGGDLAAPAGAPGAPRITEREIERLEQEISRAEAALPPMRQFILPGGNLGAAALHAARAVCRRAERRVWPLVRDGQASSESARFLNRLSDALFLLARLENHLAGILDQPWQPS